MTQPPVIMPCTDKGSMVQSTVSDSTVLNGLNYGMARLFDSFVPR